MKKLAVWTTKYINDLPDSAFLYIEAGGQKDSEGKTTPRSLRHFPYKDSSNKIDLPHLRNAIARIPQSKLPADVKERTQTKARKLLEEQSKKGSIQAPDFYAVGYESVPPEITSSQAVGEDGQTPMQRFKKDMLKVGVYIHPVWKWQLDITEERLNRFVTVFKEMRANGVDVEVPIDHSDSAADNLGYVVDMFTEPDANGVLTLYGIHEIRGQDAINLVARNKNVSVAIERDYIDGRGNSYGEAIIHSSVVQQPVLPGQDDFEIAASRGAKKTKIPVFKLSSKESNKMNEETLKKIRELLGAGDDLTEENVLSRIAEKFQALNKSVEDLQKENISLKAKTGEGGDNQTASNIDKNLAEQMGSTAEQQLSLLVSAGKITPAVKDKLVEAFVGKTGSRNVIALSIGNKGEASLLTRLVEALGENDFIKLGEQTGAQVLLRRTPGTPDKAASEKEQQGVTDEMVEMAGGAEKKT